MQQYLSPEVELFLFSTGDLLLASGNGGSGNPVVGGGDTGTGTGTGTVTPVLPGGPDDDDGPGRPLPEDTFN